MGECLGTAWNSAGPDDVSRSRCVARSVDGSAEQGPRSQRGGCSWAASSRRPVRLLRVHRRHDPAAYRGRASVGSSSTPGSRRRSWIDGGLRCLRRPGIAPRIARRIPRRRPALLGFWLISLFIAAPLAALLVTRRVLVGTGPITSHPTSGGFLSFGAHLSTTRSKARKTMNDQSNSEVLPLTIFGIIQSFHRTEALTVAL